MEAAAPELNELVGRLGDGDLGATLEWCAIQMRTGLDGEFSMPTDAYKAGGMASARASGSSYGTLLAAAFMVLTKETAGKSKLDVADIRALLATALTACKARGLSNLGDKMALVSLEAIPAAVAEKPAPEPEARKALALPPPADSAWPEWLEAWKPERVICAFDADDAGDKAAD